VGNSIFGGKQMNRRRAIGAVTAGVGAAILAACGGDTSPTATTAAASGSTGNATTRPTTAATIAAAATAAVPTTVNGSGGTVAAGTTSATTGTTGTTGTAAPAVVATGGREVRLRFSWWGADDRHQRTLKALDVYKQKTPGLTITPEYSDFTGYQDKLTTQIAGGNPPDLFQLPNTILTDFAKAGSLADLSKLVPTVLTDHDKALIEISKVDGKVYAVCPGVGTEAVMYDVTALGKAGVTLPGPDWTWDDYVTTGTAIFKALGGGVFGMDDSGGNDQAFPVWMLERGKVILTADKKVGFTKDDLTEYLTFWDTQRKAGIATNPELQTLSQGGLGDWPIIKSKSVLSVMSAPSFTGFQKLTKNELSLTPLPGLKGGKAGQTFNPPMFFAVYGKGKNIEDAAKLLDWLVTNTDAGKVLGATRGVPPSQKLRDATKADAGPDDKKLLDYVSNATSKVTATPPPLVSGGTEFDSLKTRMNEKVAFGKATIKQAVDEYFSEATRVLNT